MCAWSVHGWATTLQRTCPTTRASVTGPSEAAPSQADDRCVAWPSSSVTLAAMVLSTTALGWVSSTRAQEPEPTPKRAVIVSARSTA